LKWGWRVETGDWRLGIVFLLTADRYPLTACSTAAWAWIAVVSNRGMSVCCWGSPLGSAVLNRGDVFYPLICANLGITNVCEYHEWHEFEGRNYSYNSLRGMEPASHLLRLCTNRRDDAILLRETIRMADEKWRIANEEWRMQFPISNLQSPISAPHVRIAANLIPPQRSET
jgi:hypothetical protein